MRTHTTCPPSPDTLRAFFRDQRLHSIAEASAILGWSRWRVKHRATGDDVLMRGGFVAWSYVAWWLFETWTYEWVIRALGTDADTLLPAGLRATSVIWIAPAWIIHALDVQREVEPLPHRTVRPSTRSEYLTDLLSRGIDPNTVRLLRRDPDFMAAYHFPDGGPDA